MAKYGRSYPNFTYLSVPVQFHLLNQVITSDGDLLGVSNTYCFNLSWVKFYKIKFFLLAYSVFKVLN